ncbi:hypothetical protein UT300007_25360 [Clostridium sp. CTA-7]
MTKPIPKIPLPILFFASKFNAFNTIVYVKNHTSYTLEEATIERTGPGGHPIKLGTIKTMENDIKEEICPLSVIEKSDLIFSYMLNGVKYSSTVYGNIIRTDIRPLVIDITEENGKLIFTATRITHNDVN